MFRCTVVTNIPAVHSQNLGKTFLTDSVLGKHNLLCWQRNRLENQSLICEVDPFHGQQSMQCMSKDSNLFIRRNSHSLFILTTRFCSFPSTFFFFWGGGFQTMLKKVPPGPQGTFLYPFQPEANAVAAYSEHKREPFLRRERGLGGLRDGHA